MKACELKEMAQRAREEKARDEERAGKAQVSALMSHAQESAARGEMRIEWVSRLNDWAQNKLRADGFTVEDVSDSSASFIVRWGED